MEQSCDFNGAFKDFPIEKDISLAMHGYIYIMHLDVQYKTAEYIN